MSTSWTSQHGWSAPHNGQFTAAPCKMSFDDDLEEHRVRTMLESVSEEIRNCYAHAETCARQAAEQTDPKLREDFLALKAAWLKLARLRETDLSDRNPRACLRNMDRKWLS